MRCSSLSSLEPKTMNLDMDLKEKRRLIVVTVVVVLLLSVSGLHFFTSVHKVVYHDFYDRLYYIPIILSAFFFGVRGGTLAALIAGALFFMHLKFQWGWYTEILGRYLEIAMYLVVGIVTGILSDLERTSREKTEDAYAKLRDSFEKAKEAARLAAIGKVSAGVAHEIRNPLGGMKGAMEALASEFKPGNPKVRFVKIVDREISRINRIVEDFLNFAKPRKPDLAPANLNGLLRGVMDLHRDFLTRKSISLVFHPDERLPRCHVDPNQIRQVFLNVILNGAESMPEGGTLEILSQRTGSGVEVIFSDTGKGINPEDEEKLFEPFFTTRPRGTGMGLAISRQIMRQHGGGITLRNRKEGGKGAVVILSLPLRAPEKPKNA